MSEAARAPSEVCNNRGHLWALSVHRGKCTNANKHVDYPLVTPISTCTQRQKSGIMMLISNSRLLHMLTAAWVYYNANQIRHCIGMLGMGDFKVCVSWGGRKELDDKKRSIQGDIINFEQLRE
uniref:Uncharacterized protein n=1 Tax=Physcomitrium patens TaxID=3218 RepID=A0A2K1K6D9_PHYPA|nr:hypothetical protein PHYPA_011237 [Physcomitrium patens]